MDKSILFLKENIENNCVVICAISGGPDSMVLLNIINNLKNEKSLKIVCAHVNHKLRIESNEEYEFVKKYCNENDIVFEGIDFNNYDSTNIESEAREKRYLFFENLLKKYNSKYLLTAHHGDDLVETILMRMTRGSSLSGYVGFNKISKREKYYLLRPLIFYTKSEILKFAEKNNIEYRIDKTNFDKKYTRNRYRMDMLPLLKKENNKVHLKYLKFSEEISEANEFIDNYINEKYAEIVNNKIDVLKLKNEKDYIVKGIIYKYLLSKYNNDIKYVNDKHIKSIISILRKNRSGYVSLPKNKILYIDKKEIYFCNDKNIKNYKIILKENDSINILDGEIKLIKYTNLTNNFVTHLNSKDIKLPLYVRNKKNGDVIEVLNMNGKKKVKEILIENKIDRNIRECYPVVVDSDDNIIFIPGLKKSKYDTLKSGKYDIIVWYNKEENK